MPPIQLPTRRPRMPPAELAEPADHVRRTVVRGKLHRPVGTLR